MVKVKTADILNQIIAGMSQDQINDLTGAELLNLSQGVTRKLIYEEFPSADPRVVEALFLLHTNITQLMLAKFGIAPQDKILSGKIAIAEDFFIEQQEFVKTFGKALRETIKTLN